MAVINIIGGGLAGSECAYQLAKRGHKVKLFEMKPRKFTPAHKNQNMAELVCSNSLKNNQLHTAGGLLKEELRLLDSLLIACADKCKVPAGNALAVDREVFSELVTAALKQNKNVEIISEEVSEIDTTIPTIVATGPLTSELLSVNLQQLLGDYLYFFDAIAPIVDADSIDFSRAFIGNRYGNAGEGDYINCEMDQEEYTEFYNNLISAKTVELASFENKVYEDCMPVEVLAKRGYKGLLFGPMKPVGLRNPVTDKRPYAVVQLRKESLLNNMYNLVGFQTNLTFPEQKRVFSLIPALKNAEFSKYGVMHRNSYVNAPKVLNRYFQCRDYPNVFIAGQLSGVEGYVESIASGLVAAINMDMWLKNSPLIDFTSDTMIGGLQRYIEQSSANNFQPMGANMGLLNGVNIREKDKVKKYTMLAEKSIKHVKQLVKEYNLC